ARPMASTSSPRSPTRLWSTRRSARARPDFHFYKLVLEAPRQGYDDTGVASMRAVLFSLALLAPLPAFAQDAPRTIEVRLSNFSFAPSAIALTAGRPVIL